MDEEMEKIRERFNDFYGKRLAHSIGTVADEIERSGDADMLFMLRQTLHRAAIEIDEYIKRIQVVGRDDISPEQKPGLN